MPIPALEPSGILPPYLGSATASSNMSPYATTLVEVAQRFCATDPRKEIFRGLLAHRQTLNAIGFTDGFQWLSGSFLEDIETIDSRPPRDVDVVTFLHAPAGIANWVDLQALVNANLALFDRGQVKTAFKVDAQFVGLDEKASVIVDQTRFWFGLFSHRRNGLWKGLLQIPLAISADDTAAAALVATP
jgi:hypothetical protein